MLPIHSCKFKLVTTKKKFPIQDVYTRREEFSVFELSFARLSYEINYHVFNMILWKKKNSSFAVAAHN